MAPKPPRPATSGSGSAGRKRGFGTTWWGERWVEACEGPRPDGRYARGRTLARNGSAYALEITPGKLKARVQGSRRQPYRCELSLPVPARARRDHLFAALRAAPELVLSLLAGQLKREFGELELKSGFELFPASIDAMHFWCTCPDWGWPCKHLAAVIYLASEAFDADPLSLLAFRGIDAGDLAGLLPQASSAIAPQEPLAIAGFWDFEPPADLTAEKASPLLERLGPFPGWSLVLPLAEQLGSDYLVARLRAMGYLDRPVPPLKKKQSGRK